MITKQLISSLFLLTILVVNIRQGQSLQCYVCETSDVKNDCWEHPDKTSKVECGTNSEITTTEAATSPTTEAPASTTAAPAPTTAAPAPTTAAPAPTTAAPVPTTAAPVPTTAAPVPTTAAPVPTTAATAPTAATQPDTRAADVDYQKFSNFLYNMWKESLNESNAKIVTRSKRDTTSDWECAKIIIKSGDEKKSIERKCVKKELNTCKTESSDKECAVCSDKDLCNSASNIKLQLIPALLSVLLAFFFSSQ